MTPSPVTIIAGPCSIDEQNVAEILELSRITVNNRPALTGCRVVGLKSRTKLDDSSWMGLDYQTVLDNLDILNRGGTRQDMQQLPSIRLASQVADQTGLLIASEIMLPGIQMPLMDRDLKDKQVMAWNPSVNQLGWQVLEMAKWAQKNDWIVGLKNGKTLGVDYRQAEAADYAGSTSIETVWPGLVSYAKQAGTVLIHRGVDVPEKGDYRNLPIHHTCLRLKEQHPDWIFYLDPSHIHGPKMKHAITPNSLAALQMQTPSGQYLYEGLLIETGTSQSDTHQHLSLLEMTNLIQEIAQIREIKGR